MDKPILFSFFAGLGFLDLGFEKTGYGIAYVNEIHPPFLGAYRYAREKLGLERPMYGYLAESIEEIAGGTLDRTLSWIIKDAKRKGNDNRLVGFIGGPPCPDFSIGGKNRGILGQNGRLSLFYMEVICRFKPDFFLLENVKGLWQTRRHRDFYESLKCMAQANRYFVTERMINSIEYGVPQDRDRIILLGFSEQVMRDLSGLPADKQMELPEDAFPWLAYASYPGGTAFTYQWPNPQPFQLDSKITPPRSVPIDLTVESWFRKNDVYNHPNSGHCFKPKAGLARFKTVSEGDNSRKSFKRLHRWRYSPTACYGNNEVHLHPYKARRISAAEALAIQSLPKEFELPPDMTLSNMFKGIGNGVPYLASKALARSILKFLRFENEDNSIEYCECHCKAS